MVSRKNPPATLAMRFGDLSMLRSVIIAVPMFGPFAYCEISKKRNEFMTSLLRPAPVRAAPRVTERATLLRARRRLYAAAMLPADKCPTPCRVPATRAILAKHLNE